MVASNIYKNRQIICCLDLSSSKLICIIANIGIDAVEILGYSHTEAKGISAGAISDVKLAQKTIANSVAEAEKMAGLNIEEVIVSLNESQLKSSYQNASEKIHKEVVQNDTINNLVHKVRISCFKNNKEPIHIMPMQYRIDDSNIIANPRYMSGEKLFAKFHLITASPTTILNIENCFKKSKLSVSKYISSIYASSVACLKENELKIGTLLIDIGSESTSFCLFYSDKLCYRSAISLGGLNITKDISSILGINLAIAEKIKILNNTIILSPIEEQEVIKYRNLEMLQEITNKLPTRLELSAIIQARLEEIFETLSNNLKLAKISFEMISNIVLIGGVSQTVGIDKLAKQIYQKNTRIGYPIKPNNIPAEFNNITNTNALGMIAFMQNEFIKNQGLTPENNENWLKKILNKFIKE